MQPQFKDPQRAFAEAIEQGRLSTDESRPNYAGDFMYMGTWKGLDTFKHSGTRRYLPESTARELAAASLLAKDPNADTTTPDFSAQREALAQSIAANFATLRDAFANA